MPLNPTPLKFEGGRFCEVGYPLDALVELERYERLVIRVAKGLWKKGHSGRQRVPRFFDKSLRLRLVDVNEGSVIPVLERRDDGENGTLFDPDDWVGKSQTVITDALAAVVNGDSLPEDFPESGVQSLVQFGSSLWDEEVCLLVTQNDHIPVRYDQAARRHLIAITSSESIQVDGEILGTIGSLDANKQKFEFSDRHGSHVNGAFSQRNLFTDFREVTDRDQDAPFIRLLCRYTADAYGRLSGIEDVEELETFVSSEDPLGRPLRRMLELKDGWHDGGGCQIDSGAVEWGRDFAAEIESAAVARLSVFPTLEGGVLLETQSAHRRWSLEVDPAGGAFVTIVTGPEEIHDSSVTSVAEAVESFQEFDVS
jgi:hypothetical protein